MNTPGETTGNKTSSYFVTGGDFMLKVKIAYCGGMHE